MGLQAAWHANTCKPRMTMITDRRATRSTYASALPRCHVSKCYLKAAEVPRTTCVSVALF